MSEFIIREASIKDMDFLIAQAKEEGWNPGLHDAAAFYSCDPHGFYLCLNGEEKVGCISGVSYDESFGFIGFYIVLQAYRHLGLGHQLWKKAAEHLGGRTIGLDGVLQQQKNYEESGFKLYYNNHRFEGKGQGRASSELISLNKVPFDVLLKYDYPIFGIDRSVFLQHWIQMPNAISLAKYEKGKLLGYGVIRSCFYGYKIGPLFADRLDIALEIFESLSFHAKDAPVFLDIPEVNPEALQIVEQFHLKPVFQTVRMYTKMPPKQELNKIFGVTSFELG